MKVISTNLGKPTRFIWKGKEVQTGIFKKPVVEPLHLNIHEVTNDTVVDRKHHAGVDKACYLFSQEEYDFWKPKYPNLKWEWGMFGENLTVQGLNESTLRIGDIYRLGTALVQISQPREPCYKLGVRFENQDVVSQFVSRGKPGTYVRILETGEVKNNDLMILEKQSEHTVTVKEFYDFRYAVEKDQSLLQRILNNPAVPEHKRKRFKKFMA